MYVRLIRVFQGKIAVECHPERSSTSRVRARRWKTQSRQSQTADSLQPPVQIRANMRATTLVARLLVSLTLPAYCH